VSSVLDSPLHARLDELGDKTIAMLRQMRDEEKALSTAQAEIAALKRERDIGVEALKKISCGAVPNGHDPAQWRFLVAIKALAEIHGE
jgi:hypothetical protein